LKRTDPVYPPLVRQARVSGTVRVAAIIIRSGHVTDVSATFGHPLLKQAAIDAVKKWTYSPSTLNGEPVDVTTNIDVTFNLGK
jgi:protein TonB